MRQILIVDDEPLIRDVLAEVLGDEGYRVHTAADGQEALEAIDHHVPDLLITDIMMPRLSGWHLLAQVRTVHPTLPVLLCSAVDPHITGHTEHLADHTAFLAKPFALDAFLDLVTQLIARTRSS